MLGSVRVAAFILTPLLWLAGLRPACFAAEEGRRSLTMSVEVDLGQDVGQSFGSLFEVTTPDGQIVAGAGFQDVYNTRFRSNRHKLQFFVRPTSGRDQFTLTRLPHPDLDCGVYLFDCDEDVYAFTSAHGNAVRRWDAEEQRWEPALPPGMQELRSGDGLMRVGSGRLTFANSTATFDDRIILSPPAAGHYYNFYYAQGALCFYHHDPADGGSTRIYACRWTPEDASPIDIDQAAFLETAYPRETPFAWGQWEDQVLTVSNMGGVYVFENDDWKTVLNPDDRTSYQVYSILRWYDRLLLAQYPTGHVFSYRGDTPTEMEGWPPRLPGVSSSARECQTLSIYRGDLLAGVWPWAELWRRERDSQEWFSLGRMFTHPQTTDEFTHPYETAATDLGLVANYWGQRVTSLVPQKDSLLISTSAKGTVEWKDDYTFLTDDQRREYGAVLKLTMPGNLATQIRWQDRPIRLTFRVDPNRLVIEQEGKILAQTDLPQDWDRSLGDLRVRWGDGPFGPLRGRLVSHTMSTTHKTTVRTPR